MFGFKKKKITFSYTYNPEVEKPVIRASICTGEQTVGFKNLTTGKFVDIICVDRRENLDAFLEFYNLKEEDISTEY